MKTIIYNPEQLFAKTFGLQLSAVLNSRNIPVQEVALSCNIHYNQMTSYMRGEHMPTMEIIIRFCNYFSVHIEYFIPSVDQQPALIMSDESFQIDDKLDMALKRTQYCQHNLNQICDKGYFNKEISDLMSDDLMLISNVLWSVKKSFQKQYDISLKTFK